MSVSARRRAAPGAITLASVFALVASTSCTVGGPSTSHAAVVGAAAWAGPSVSTRQILTSRGWTNALSPLYTDDQRFHTSASDYGPYVAMFPGQALDTMTSFEPAGSDGRLVAMIEVVKDDPANPAPLTATYTDLQLQYGLNCLYLRRTANSAQGFVRLANPNCPDTYSNATPLPVTPVLNAQYPGAANVPAVARFHEGSNQTLSMVDGAPYIGLKCNEAWCLFIPASVTPLATPQSGDDDGADLEHQVAGWGDAQHLGKPRGSSTGGTTPSQSSVIPSGKTAWITADPNLKNITRQQFVDDYQLVATVKFRHNPDGKYKSDWSFGGHENEVWIKADDTNLTSWTGYIARKVRIFGIPIGVTKHIAITIDRDPHPGMTIPATARFRWDPNDEDIWVRCDDGCCKVSEGGS